MIMRTGRAQKAFTLFEVMIGVVIVSIILLYGALSMSRAKHRSQLKLQAETLVSDLKYARSIAMTEGSSTIDFSSSNSGYYVIKNASGQIKTKTSLFSGVIFTLPSGSSVFTFKSTGAADHGGVFRLSANIEVTYKVTLTAETGMVILQQ